MKMTLLSIFLVCLFSTFPVRSDDSDACKKKDAAGICDCRVNNGNCRVCIDQGKCGW